METKPTIIYYKKQGAGILLLGCQNTPSHLEIPREIAGLPVVTLADFAFAPKEELPIAEEKTHGNLEFVECLDEDITISTEGYLLESLFLPDTITTIGAHVFDGCKGLTSLVLPSQIVELPEYTFGNCVNLTHVGLPTGLEHLGAYAFYGCLGLEHLQLPQSLISIGKYAFYNCRNLQSINIPPVCDNLGMGIFLNCDTVFDIALEKASHMSELVAGLNQALRLTITFPDGKAQILLPDYQSEYIENTPARMLSQVHYGSGHVYRQCVGKYAVDFRQYDKLFYMAKREDAGVLALLMALGRLQYPYRLYEEYRNGYLEYIKEHFTFAVQYLLQHKEEATLEQFGDWNVYTKENIKEVIALAQKIGKTALVGYLLQYQRVHFGEGKKKTFDL
ncbi:leucine-rich repeat domain-containing protein [Chakrabartyella piscis]|uniref:leucine-rich repeat domain-containing protein n=1 Tax=Chakrabartyella piscis TaxID=2918914 RepID=UPI0029587AD3|nr:leucine-rich repeat domain-containing protein [Chakrabartyella piscis]